MLMFPPGFLLKPPKRGVPQKTTTQSKRYAPLSFQWDPCEDRHQRVHGDVREVSVRELISEPYSLPEV